MSLLAFLLAALSEAEYAAYAAAQRRPTKIATMRIRCQVRGTSMRAASQEFSPADSVRALVGKRSEGGGPAAGLSGSEAGRVASGAVGDFASGFTVSTDVAGAASPGDFATGTERASAPAHAS